MSSMAELVKFLTARLDERESGIRDALRTEDWGVTQTDLDDIESKRRIMEIAQGLRDHESRPLTGDRILRLLAMPYAYHPDYSPEWAVNPSTS